MGTTLPLGRIRSPATFLGGLLRRPFRRVHFDLVCSDRMQNGNRLAGVTEPSGLLAMGSSEHDLLAGARLSNDKKQSPAGGDRYRTEAARLQDAAELVEIDDDAHGSPPSKCIR